MRQRTEWELKDFDCKLKGGGQKAYRTNPPNASVSNAPVLHAHVFTHEQGKNEPAGRVDWQQLLQG